MNIIQLTQATDLGDDSLARIVAHLGEQGLRVVSSFDTRTSRADVTWACCPCHGTASCTCQVAVLLVFRPDGESASLLVHQRDGRTRVLAVMAPGQTPSPALERSLMQALTPLALPVGQAGSSQTPLPDKHR